MRSLHFALLQSRWRVEGFTLFVAMTWFILFLYKIFNNFFDTFYIFLNISFEIWCLFTFNVKLPNEDSSLYVILSEAERSHTFVANKSECIEDTSTKKRIL